MRKQYRLNKNSKIGNRCKCPSCGAEFIKSHYQQKFCKTKKGTQCKDKYWNTVIENKRNNTERISPANRAWRDRNLKSFDPDDQIHPFSLDAFSEGSMNHEK